MQAKRSREIVRVAGPIDILCDIMKVIKHIIRKLEKLTHKTRTFDRRGRLLQIIIRYYVKTDFV